MNRIILLMLMVVSPFASTSTLMYEINLEVFLDGKKVSSPRVITNIGEVASISQFDGESGYGIEVLSQESTFNGASMIHLKLKVESIQKDGKRVLLAKPEILTHENEMAEVTVGNKDSDNDLTLNVIAKRRL